MTVFQMRKIIKATPMYFFFLILHQKKRQTTRNYFHYLFRNYIPYTTRSCLVSSVTNPNSNEYKFTAIGFDIAGHRLFKPVGIKKNGINERSLTKLCKQRS